MIDYAKFWETIDELLLENDYTTKDIVEAEFVDFDTVKVTLKDGTVITVRRKKTGFYVDDSDDGDGSGTEGGGTEESGNDNSSSNPVPPGKWTPI